MKIALKWYCCQIISTLSAFSLLLLKPTWWMDLKFHVFWACFWMIMQVGLEVFLLRNQSYLLSFYPLIAHWMPSFSLYHTTSCLSFPKNSHNIGGHCDFWTPCSSKMKEYKNRECNSCEEHWNHLTTLHNSQNNPAVFFYRISLQF